MSDTVTAPFIPEQVESLNGFQNARCFHPFTCGGDRMDDAHRAYRSEHGGDYGQLIAREDGWFCPVCDYRQDWAHVFMAGGEWREIARRHEEMWEKLRKGESL